MLYDASTGDFDVRLAQATHFLCATLDHHRKPLRVRPACFPAHRATLVDPSLCFRVLSRSIYVLETGQGACAGSIPTSRACPASTILANLFCARARMLVTMCPIHSRPLDIQTELTVNYTQTVLA